MNPELRIIMVKALFSRNLFSALELANMTDNALSDYYYTYSY